MHFLPVRRAERDVGVQVLEVVVAVQAFACLGGGQCDERHAHLLAADGFNAAQAFLQQDIAPVQVDAVGSGCLQLMLEFFVNGKIADVDGAADLVADIPLDLVQRAAAEIVVTDDALGIFGEKHKGLADPGIQRIRTAQKLVQVGVPAVELGCKFLKRRGIGSDVQHFRLTSCTWSTISPSAFSSTENVCVRQ